jgi:hypothetical protein
MVGRTWRRVVHRLTKVSVILVLVWYSEAQVCFSFPIPQFLIVSCPLALREWPMATSFFTDFQCGILSLFAQIWCFDLIAKIWQHFIDSGVCLLMVFKHLSLKMTLWALKL